VLSRHLSTVGVHVADDAYSVPYTYKGSAGSEYFDVVFVRKGQSESILWFFDLRRPTPTGVIIKVAIAAASQLQDG
jgi:hypothetical protein